MNRVEHRMRKVSRTEVGYCTNNRQVNRNPICRSNLPPGYTTVRQISDKVKFKKCNERNISSVSDGLKLLVEGFM